VRAAVAFGFVLLTACASRTPVSAASPPVTPTASLHLAQLCSSDRTPGDRITTPRLLSPNASEEACVNRAASIPGVEMEGEVDASGRVIRARVVRSVPQIDARCLERLAMRVFRPAQADGRTRSGWVTLLCDERSAGGPTKR